MSVTDSKQASLVIIVLRDTISYSVSVWPRINITWFFSLKKGTVCGERTLPFIIVYSCLENVLKISPNMILLSNKQTVVIRLVYLTVTRFSVDSVIITSKGEKPSVKSFLNVIRLGTEFGKGG